MKKIFAGIVVFSMVVSVAGAFPLAVLAESNQNQHQNEDSHNNDQHQNDSHDSHDNHDNHDNHDGHDDHGDGHTSTDVCPNIDGVQATVPDGDQINSDGQCVPIIPVCTATDVSQTIVSDTTTQEADGDSALVTPLNSRWTAVIPGASWIWDINPIIDPVTRTTETLSRSFTIAGAPIGATIDIAADNGYDVAVNGHEVHADMTEFNYQSNPADDGSTGQDSFSIPVEDLVSGTNIITFTVTNFAMDGGTPETNPGGLLYKLVVHEDDCQIPPVTPPTDVCSNIDGVQATVPNGDVLLNNQCVPVAVCTENQTLDTTANTCVDNQVPPTDVCPNIDGVQATVPDGDSVINGQCVTTPTTPVDNGNPPSNNPPAGGNGPIAGSNFAGGNGPIVSGGNGNGQVLGASCSVYLTSYLGLGKKNDPEQVKKLQTFLNNYLHMSIPVTGFFGKATLEGVNQFQVQENADVLSPWIKTGLQKDKEPSGYVYKTTKRKINMIMCPDLDLPAPQLP